MPPALPPQLRSAARSFAQHSSKSIRREFHQSVYLRATEPSRAGEDASSDSVKPPIAGGLPETDELPKDLQKNVKLRELYADFISKRADIQQLLRGQGITSSQDGGIQVRATPAGDERPPSKPQEAKLPFHGSGLRRRLRANPPREAQRIVERRAPSWFLRRNVQLKEDFSDAVRAPEDVEVDLQARNAGSLRLGSMAYQGHSLDSTEAAAKTNQEDVEARQNQCVPPLLKPSDIPLPQWRELEAVARGLLRLPRSEASHFWNTTPAGPQLLLAHPDNSSKVPSAVWRDTIMKLAQTLDCDVVELNAQDIGELISNAGLENEITSQALSLNYDIWDRTKPQDLSHTGAVKTLLESDAGRKDTRWKGEDDEDPDEMDESMWTSGTPMIIGKPFTLDITKMLQSRSGGRGGGRPSSIMSALFDEEPSRSSDKKYNNHIFKDLVNSVLSAPEEKRSKAAIRSSATQAGAGLPVESTSEHEQSVADSTPGVPHRRALIYIEAFDAIEDHPLGTQFLFELYHQVHRRRNNGYEEIIVGAPPYVSQKRMDIPGGLDTGASTRTVMMTPNVSPEQVSRYKELNTQKLTMMNHRNLQMVLQTKWDIKAWESSDMRSPNYVAGTSTMPQTDLPWDKEHVQRLAAVMWGQLEGDSKQVPSITEAQALLEESDRSKTEWRRQRRKERPQIQLLEDTQVDRIRSTATKHEKALLAGVIEPAKISVTFKDVHAPCETIEAIQTMTTLSLVRPEAFRYGVLASDRLPGLLLYGPPGTGKTLLAKAVAKESGATVLSVSSAQLNDMYVGEGEKNVAALFSLAKKLTPCVIFLDEADAIFSARGNRGSRVNHRELLNQFLTEWDGMSNDANGAFIMAATNRPMDLDDAVLRRLPRRLLVDLPTEADRLAILDIHLRDEVLAEGVDLADLAKKTPFYSGSDLKNLAVAAALECVREENDAAKKHVGDEAYKHAEKRTLTEAHFEKAFSEISASISEDMTSLRDIKKFDEQYGDKRGKKRRSARWGFNTTAEANKVLDTVKVRS
jgi:SpoVK/Ycf46/Vps4 family AAA+-type ATPase